MLVVVVALLIGLVITSSHSTVVPSRLEVFVMEIFLVVPLVEVLSAVIRVVVRLILVITRLVVVSEAATIAMGV